MSDFVVDPRVEELPGPEEEEEQRLKDEETAAAAAASAAVEQSSSIEQNSGKEEEEEEEEEEDDDGDDDEEEDEDEDEDEDDDDDNDEEEGEEEGDDEKQENGEFIESGFENITEALSEKDQGNNYFRDKLYDDAIECYSKAIYLCPKDDANKTNLATFFGNRAAAYFSLEEYELVVEDCTQALELKEDYVKVLARRMQSNEKLEKVEEALADAKKIQELDPSYHKINVIVARLQKEHDVKMEKMKDEALGKLKELGNSILGNFGMSLDSFNMKQDPATGSWSINMGK